MLRVRRWGYEAAREQKKSGFHKLLLSFQGVLQHHTMMAATAGADGGENGVASTSLGPFRGRSVRHSAGVMPSVTRVNGLVRWLPIGRDIDGTLLFFLGP